MEFHSFGDWLKRKRKALDFTQAELASQVGCSAAAIRKLEAEERRPSMQIAERLAEIFNIPTEERTEFLRFARGELRSAPAEVKEDFPWHPSARAPRSNLPAAITSLVGRQQEIALIREYLLNPEIRLVSLVGPPGIGKTRLSIESARAVLPDFADGVFFIPLAPLDDSSLLVFTIAQALGYVEAKRQPAQEQLIEGIGEKQMLMVLDNCEHLVENVAILSSHILSACPHVKLIATSRESLRIPGEWIYAIPTLKIPEASSLVDIETAFAFPALTLFAERARAVRSDFVLNAHNLQDVAAICAQLDGMPLAIELIAARMRLMTPQALLAHLNHEFVLSADGMRSISSRQKTLHDAIAWSYNLLSEAEQKLFAYLSVFSGVFTAENVETIFSGMFSGTPVSALITSLLDKSLLQHAFNSHGQTHFNMLVTIHAFALHRLQSMGRETDARNKHLAYFFELAEGADKEVRGPNQVQWLQRFGALRDNLRSALEWAIESGRTETALRLASRLDWTWFVRSDHSEGRYWLEHVLTMPDAQRYPGPQAEALTQLAHHMWLQIGAKETRHPAEQALGIARANQDKWNTARALSILGLVLINEGKFGEARTTLEQSQTFFREVHDDWGYAHAVMCLALIPFRQDDRESALALYEQVLVLFRELGDSYFQSVALRFIGVLHMKLERLALGVTALQEALTLSQQLDSKYEIAAELWNFGIAAQASGKMAQSVALYWASKNILDSIGAWSRADATEFENRLATCRSALSEVEFAIALEKGRAMTMEQAIAYALENQD